MQRDLVGTDERNRFLRIQEGLAQGDALVSGKLERTTERVRQRLAARTAKRV
jgi:hypothetical protein